MQRKGQKRVNEGAGVLLDRRSTISGPKSSASVNASADDEEGEVFQEQKEVIAGGEEQTGTLIVLHLNCSVSFTKRLNLKIPCPSLQCDLPGGRWSKRNRERQERVY